MRRGARQVPHRSPGRGLGSLRFPLCGAPPPDVPPAARCPGMGIFSCAFFLGLFSGGVTQGMSKGSMLKIPSRASPKGGDVTHMLPVLWSLGKKTTSSPPLKATCFTLGLKGSRSFTGFAPGEP